MGGFIIGWDVSLGGVQIIAISHQLDLSAFEHSAVLVVVPVVTLFAAMWAGKHATEYGRRSCVSICAWALMTGATVSASSYSFWSIFCGRGLSGVALGFCLTAIPVYISECAPAEHRGKLVFLSELFNSFAAFCAYGSATLLQKVLVDDDHNPDTPIGWRIMVGSSLLLGVGLLALAQCIPESPRWYCSRGRFDDAQEATVALHGDTAQARHEVQTMVESYVFIGSVATPRAVGEQGYTGLLCSSDTGLKRAVLIGTVLQALYTTCHLQAAYVPTILISGGFTVSQMLHLQTLNQALRIVMSAIGLSVIDSWGRRPVLFGVFSLVIMGFGMMALGFHSQTEGWHVLSRTIVAIGVALVYMARAIQPRGVEVELFPMRMRALGKGWTTTVFKVVQASIVGSLLFWDLVGWTAILATQGTLGCVGLVFVYNTLPETKNKSLEVIEHQLRVGGVKTPVNLSMSKHASTEDDISFATGVQLEPMVESK